MTPHKQAKCPQCGEPADLSTDNPARPFCSHRCKLIDLGDWMDERHSIPGDDAPSSGNDPYDEDSDF